MIWVALLMVKEPALCSEPDRSRAGKILAVAMVTLITLYGGPVFGLLSADGRQTATGVKPIPPNWSAGTGRGGIELVTSTVPIPAGEVAVIWVALLMVKERSWML